MAGFPTRPSRRAFGPTFRDRAPVRQPDRDVGAAAFNLLCWQAAGAGVVGALAWALLTWDGAALSLAAGGEAWDSDGLVVPTVARSSAGVYVVTYAATYPDADGIATTTSLCAGQATPQSASPLLATVELTNAHAATVRVWNLSAIATDASVLVVLR